MASAALAATSSSSAAAAVAVGSMALRAAIVGSGAAGLAAAKALCGAGMAVTVFEASKHVGGLWNYSDDGSTGVMYKSLHTNLPKGVCTHTHSTHSFSLQLSCTFCESDRDHGIPSLAF